MAADEIYKREGETLVSRADWIPGFWNFLGGLDRDDLIAELIQNDFDQGATKTEISFQKERLVSIGNGRPVDSDGWKRLQYIQGAGEEVPAKKGKIGVKNHGLKTAFTIGDTLFLRSKGHSIQQTLFANGPGAPPKPGASEHPLPDPLSPKTGCQVEIVYRRNDLKPPVGEKITLGKSSEENIDKVFFRACTLIPVQFAGLVSPFGMKRYEIVLSHWKFGAIIFRFSCGKESRLKNGMILFRRHCRISGELKNIQCPKDFSENVVQRAVKIEDEIGERLPTFFRRRGGRYAVEVAWPIDSKGRPVEAVGLYRYPIGYVGDTPEAKTGFGFYFCGPFISTTDRHAPMWADTSNDHVNSACHELMIDAIVYHLVPKWGPFGLRPLLQGSSEASPETLRPILGRLVQLDAIPKVAHYTAKQLLSKRNRSKIAEITRSKIKPPPSRYLFVIPQASWESHSLSSDLTELCPTREWVIHPEIDSRILEILPSKEVDGWCEKFATFDEQDALERAVGDGNEWFPRHEAEKRGVDFSSPSYALAFLNVADESLKRKKWKQEDEERLIKAILLPDEKSCPQSLVNLHTSIKVPLDIPGLELPPIFHPTIASHHCLRRTHWRRSRFDLLAFLKGPRLAAVGEEVRRQFWNWVSRQGRHLNRSERQVLPDLPIWPAIDGSLSIFDKLCEPRSKIVSKILASHISRPHPEIFKSGLVDNKGKGRTRIRKIPLLPEISSWVKSRMESIPLLSSAPEDISNLQRFESELIRLLSDPEVSQLLPRTWANLPCLAADGFIRPRKEVVRESKALSVLALSKRFILGSSNPQSNQLDAITSPLSVPSAEMIVSSFREDTDNFKALHARLKLLMDLNVDPESISGLSIVPYQGKAFVPNSMAFKGKRGDYWGTWKVRLTADGLSQDDQKRLIWAGVIPSKPADELMSRSFFHWLHGQDADVLKEHIPCVIRQLSNSAMWSELMKGERCIPVERGGILRLMSFRQARNDAFLPDHKELSAAIWKDSKGPWLIIDKAHEVTEPITETLRNSGIRSLREEASSPVYAQGEGAVDEAPRHLIEKIEALKIPTFRRSLIKRMAEIGISRIHLKDDWLSRVQQVQRVQVADRVVATYVLGKRSYGLEPEAAYDQKTGTAWLRRNITNPSEKLLEMIAEQRIFKPGVAPINFLGLKRALETDLAERSFGRPGTNAQEEGDFRGDGEESEKNEGQGEASFGHSPFEPDPTRNRPDPKPFSDLDGNNNTKNRDRKGNSKKDAKRSGGGNRTEQSNSQHKDQLKDTEYACHCQACLAVREPNELAPNGSYIEFAEVRRHIIEGHHADARSGGGPDHAGNIILLCRYHHANFGRRLSRIAITEALSQGIPAAKSFEGDIVKCVEGTIASVAITDAEEPLKLFFSKEHAAFWLKSSSLSGYGKES